MRAMILAAGLGTRLQPLTDTRPKALVEIGGRTLLEIAILRLRAFGVREVIVNVHHFPEMIVEYLESRRSFGIRIEVSREPELLDTGGGLRKAAWFFLEDPDRLDEPFIVHNVDVVSGIDLQRMREFHLDENALATLAVQERETSRYLLFDEESRLAGRHGKDQELRTVPGEGPVTRLGFTGLHVVSPRLFSVLGERWGFGAFSIIDAYLDLAARGERILGFRADAWPWRDVGSPESLARAVEEGT